MVSREDQWTQMHLAYREGTFAREFVAKELAQACLTFRDAAWAADLYPSCSHGQLGVSTTSDYLTARQRRAIWLAADEAHHPVVTFQDNFGSSAGRTERIPDLGQTTLKALAKWVRGSDA
jgi:hypothetical protein